jgi:octaprenyl-diphosphate synthase
LASEAELRAQMKSDVSLVQSVSEHTLAAGGKRLRPALCLLSGLATGNEFDSDRMARLGACIEMIHMATLIHDDVLDGATMRRGRPTAASVFGDTAGILSGDVLLAKAMRILAVDGDLRIIRMISESVVEMAEGEVLELELRGQFDLPMETHLKVLRMKTAAFVECCCRVGAIVAGAEAETEDRLGRYGHHLGMAFQIVDDLLDYCGEQERTGKRRATDFYEGCMTIPLFLLRDKLEPAERADVSHWFGNGVKPEQVNNICQWMAERGVVTETRAIADEHRERAFAELRILPASPERELLECMTEFVTQRDN